MGPRQAPICHIHNVPEPDLPGDYKVCGECWHVWRSEDDFRLDCDDWGPDFAVSNLSEVWFCPLCTHAF